MQRLWLAFVMVFVLTLADTRVSARTISGAGALPVLTLRVTGPALTGPALIDLPASAFVTAGWPLTQIDPATVQITHRGQELPAEVTTDSQGQLARVRVLAPANETPFSTTTVLWLHAGQAVGQRAAIDGTPTMALVWEAETVYAPSLASARGDSWFGGELYPGQGFALSLTLQTALPAGSPLVLAVGSLVNRSDHRLTLRTASGQFLAQARWDDPLDGPTSPVTRSLTLAAGLPAGHIDLALTLSSPGTDRVLLDRLLLPTALVALPTFTPLLTAAPTHDLRTGPVPGQAGADYLIITHASLRPALDPLITLRQAEGFTVGVLDVADIYAGFSGGERDPEAIRSLLVAARSAWSPAPRAVLLVGAGTAQMRGGPARTPTPGLALSDAPIADPLIPPYLVRGVDVAGEIACDTCYTRLDTPDVRDDLLPDIPIGRLPVRSLDEARSLIAKIVAYATRPPPGGWQSRAMVLTDNDREADGTDDPAGSFTATAQVALARLPAGMLAQTFAYDGGDATGPLRCRLFRALDGGSPNDTSCPPNPAGADTGASLLLYVGHGSPWQWATTTPSAGTPYLFYLYDVDGRRNGGRLPMVLSMTCLSGNWANPYLQSLDERMLLWPQGGSIASLTSTGSGVNTGHARLLAGLLPVLTAPSGDRSLGAAHLAGLAALPPYARDLAYGFHILGDPLTRLPAVPIVRLNFPLVRR